MKKSGIVIICLAMIIAVFIINLYLKKENIGESGSSAGYETGYEVKNVLEEPITRTAFALDTFITVTIYSDGDEQILDGAVDIISGYEDIFSAHKEGSELYNLNNRGAGITEVEVSDELAYLIDKGLYYSRISDGAYDITMEPLKELWDFNSPNPSLPSGEALEAALKKVDYKNVSVEKNIVYLKSDDTKIDLGSIAKGYIADKTKEYLAEKGVSSAIINLGGNVLCLGNKPDGSNFNIGLQKPYADRNETVEILSVNDWSVVSSGVYERHFIIDGINYHHILNPDTGYPYDNGLVGVSILTKSSTDADALSTTVFSLGLDKGMELINSIPDTYGYFILEDYTIVFSDGAMDYLTKE